MILEERIKAFATLGRFLGQFGEEQSESNIVIPHNDTFHDRMLHQLQLAQNHNGWFTNNNLRFACESWSKVLTENNLRQWVNAYKLTPKDSKTIAIIMAGNVPLVGFHDFLSVLITGNKVLVKLASGDKILLPLLSDYLTAVASDFENYISFTEKKLENFDAIIATGSNNTARYFDYYFGKYPNIIRKNRNSIAILSGNESPEQLDLLAKDIFRYFGLGCRNVSKLYVPEGYNFDSFFNGMYSWKEIIYNNKYMNNYDYNKAVYLMNSVKLLDNEFLLLKEDEGHSSPIAVIFYEYYKNRSSLEKRLSKEADQIQCIVSDGNVRFGETQCPQLWEYADGVDTLEFLLNLS